MLPNGNVQVLVFVLSFFFGGGGICFAFFFWCRFWFAYPPFGEVCVCLCMYCRVSFGVVCYAKSGSDLGNGVVPDWGAYQRRFVLCRAWYQLRYSPTRPLRHILY